MERKNLVADFYHIYIRPNLWTPQEEVEKVMSLAIDWFRYTPDVYVVYSTASIDQWYGRLELLVKPWGFIFVCRLDVTKANGWMSKEFWEWLDKYRYIPGPLPYP
jgi:hypothetical protein